MTVASGLPLEVSTAAGAVTAGVPIEANWNVTDKDEMLVLYNVDQVAVRGVDYTVTLKPTEYATADVVPTAALVAALDGTNPLVIRRNMAFTQQYDASALLNLPPVGLEGALDRHSLYAQQLQAEIDRCLKFSLTPSGSAELNLADTGAGTYLGRDASPGTELVWLSAPIELEQPAFDTEAEAAAASLPASGGVNHFRTAGGAALGDGDQALFYRDAGGTDLTTADGSKWTKIVDASAVTIAGVQTVTGAKTFSAALTASAGVTGNLTGNVTGDVTGDVTGNADTATALNTVALASAGLSDVLGYASQAEAEAGSVTNKTMNPLRTSQAIAALAASGGAVQGTPVATTSGVSVDVTGIPAGVKAIAVLFDSVSLDGSSDPQIQLGTSVSVETSGYAGFVDVPASANAAHSSGFVVHPSPVAAQTMTGGILLLRENSSTNVWIVAGILGRDGTVNIAHVAGRKALSGTLDRFRLTTVGGADNFDAGELGYIYWT